MWGVKIMVPFVGGRIVTEAPSMTIILTTTYEVCYREYLLVGCTVFSGEERLDHVVDGGKLAPLRAP